MTLVHRVRLDRAVRGEAGQGLVEYALILVLVAIVAIASLAFLGGHLSTYLSNIGNSV